MIPGLIWQHYCKFGSIKPEFVIYSLKNCPRSSCCSDFWQYLFHISLTKSQGRLPEMTRKPEVPEWSRSPNYHDTEFFCKKLQSRNWDMTSPSGPHLINEADQIVRLQPTPVTKRAEIFRVFAVLLVLNLFHKPSSWPFPMRHPPITAPKLCLWFT